MSIWHCPMNRHPLIIVFFLSQLGICLFHPLFSLESSNHRISVRALRKDSRLIMIPRQRLGALSAEFSCGVDSRCFLTSSISCGFVNGEFWGFFHVEIWEIKFQKVELRRRRDRSKDQEVVGEFVVRGAWNRCLRGKIFWISEVKIQYIQGR